MNILTQEEFKERLGLIPSEANEVYVGDKSMYNKCCSIFQTGTPTEEGWYLVEFKDHGKGNIPYDVVRWTGKWGIYWEIPKEEIVAWWKIVPSGRNNEHRSHGCAEQLQS